MSEEDSHEQLKQAILEYVKKRFREIEQDLAMSHEDKYAKLEDAVEESIDEDELKVAFERWFMEHKDDMKLQEDIDELWEQALIHQGLK